MIGFYGPVMFETSTFLGHTFHQFGRERKLRYATHDLLDGGQALQFLGRDLETVSISIHLSNDLLVPFGSSPRIELELLAMLAATGRAQLLIVGLVPLGMYVIEDISETWKRVSAAGSLNAADLELKLREYA
jgi:phage protein U